MQRCNGNTLKGSQCDRHFYPEQCHLMRGRYYCDVHYAKQLHHLQNNAAEGGDDDALLPLHLLKVIPDPLKLVCDKMAVRELEHIFLNMYNDQMGGSFEEVMKVSYEHLIPDKYLVGLVPEVLKNVRGMKESDLELVLNIVKNEFLIAPCEQCRHEFLTKFLLQCSGGHKFCSECLTKYFSQRIMSRKFDLRCGKDGICGSGFSHETLQATLNDQLYGDYLDWEMDRDKKEAENKELYQFFWDKQIECEDQTKEIVNEILNRHRVRVCPECLKVVKRSDENAKANKVSCECGVKLCYLCKKKIEGYMHFNDNDGMTFYGRCDLFTDEVEIERKDTVAALDEICDTYKFDLEILVRGIFVLLMKMEGSKFDMILEKFKPFLFEAKGKINYKVVPYAGDVKVETDIHPSFLKPVAAPSMKITTLEDMEYKERMNEFKRKRKEKLTRRAREEQEKSNHRPDISAISSDDVSRFYDDRYVSLGPRYHINHSKDKKKSCMIL
ncbi:MAG: putative E3 ubiquitin-protein ligase RNF216 [Hyperionvirus sp.]|uniref:Putative E3 ubiquitin-protein ligase RNF216 n=1 Tax=Hyperionvirus sp. TaxID=2487770 RepID=A0A3G5AC41_9VIRU|nr:MAG: putative E3 ubiquitin-protein ligase RNF216 [Hyperionvirus sp.]